MDTLGELILYGKCRLIRINAKNVTMVQNALSAPHFRIDLSRRINYTFELKENQYSVLTDVRVYSEDADNTDDFDTIQTIEKCRQSKKRLPGIRTGRRYVGCVYLA